MKNEKVKTYASKKIKATSEKVKSKIEVVSNRVKSAVKKTIEPKKIKKPKESVLKNTNANNTPPKAVKSKAIPPNAKILITLNKPETGKSPYLDLEKKCQLTVHYKTFFDIVGVTMKDFKKQNINIQNFHSIILTSKTAVDHFFRIAEESKLKLNQDLKYYCLSETVALYLQKFIQYRKRKVFFSPDNSNLGLCQILERFKDEQYLYVTSKSTEDEISQFLKLNAYNFTSASFYEIIPCQNLQYEFDQEWDNIVFFSPNSVKVFIENIAKFKKVNRISGFGKSTVDEMKSLNNMEIITAPIQNLLSMSAVLENYYSKKSGI